MFSANFRIFPDVPDLFHSIPEHSRAFQMGFGEFLRGKSSGKIGKIARGNSLFKLVFVIFVFLRGSVRGSLECVLAEFGGYRRLV